MFRARNADMTDECCFFRPGARAVNNDNSMSMITMNTMKCSSHAHAKDMRAMCDIVDCVTCEVQMQTVSP
jgi:hypothetical protein